MGEDKGMIMWRGMPLALHSAAILKPNCNRIVFLSNNPDYVRFGYEVWEDDQKGMGPVGGIVTALRKTDTEMNLFLACDLPLMKPDLFHLLLQSMEDDRSICLPVESDKIHPLCGIWTKSALECVESQVADGQMGITRIAEHCHSQLVSINGTFEEDVSEWFTNVNRPEDLEKLQ